MLISGTVNSISPISSNVFAQEPIDISWVKTTAGWWANGIVDDATFFKQIEWLVEKKIIQLDEKSKDTSLYQNIVKSETSVKDTNWLTGIKDTFGSALKKVQDDPTADLMIKSILPSIPIAGSFLANIYEQSKGTTAEKNQLVEELLKKYQAMDNVQLLKVFTKLEENKAAIKNNTYLLTDLSADTKQILAIVDDTNIRVKGIETTIDENQKENNKRFDELRKLVTDSKVGKNTVVSEEVIKSANEITQTYTDASNLDSSQLEVLAKSYLLKDDFNSAIKIYDQILQQDSKNYNALNEKAWALYDLGQFSQSDAAFGKFLSYYPEDSEGWEGKGWNLLELNESYLPEARDSFNESLRWDNTNAFAIAGLGWISLEEGDCQMAKLKFDEALKIDEYNVDAFDGLDSMTEYDC